MKPIIEINHKERGSPRHDRARRGRQSFPLTDYNYHPTADAEAISPAGRPAIQSPAFHELSSEFLGRPAIQSPAFHELSSEFLGAETSRDYVAELLFFILITGIAAWPVISMLIAVTRLIRNY